MGQRTDTEAQLTNCLKRVASSRHSPILGGAIQVSGAGLLGI